MQQFLEQLTTLLTIRNALDIRAVKWIDSVLEVALQHLPGTAAKSELPAENVKAGESSTDEKVTPPPVRPH